MRRPAISIVGGGPAARLATALAMVAVTAWLVPDHARAQPDEYVIQVHGQQSLGSVPQLFRPSAMVAWADLEAIDLFLSLPGPHGAVRLTLEPALTQSRDLESYRKALREAGPALQKLSAGGAKLIVTFARMPRWIAARSEERSAGEHGYSIREASPPRDLRKFEDLAYETVRILNGELGYDLWYEFWNEPDARSFWRGTRKELFESYAAFVRGARRADPEARVGGLALGGWDVHFDDEPAGSTPPLMADFFAFLGDARRVGLPPSQAPIDFLSWHNFSITPESGWWGVAEMEPWIVAAGLPPQLPHVITEWNRWATFPEWFDPERDGAAGAAYIMAALHAMNEAGISLQTIAALEDFNAPPPGEAFIGGFGLVTRAPIVKKAAFHVLDMLARLGTERIAVTVPDDLAVLDGVGGIAARSDGRLTIIVHRFAGDKLGAFIRSTRRAGLRRFSNIGVSPDRLVAFIKEEVDLRPGEAPAAVAATLNRARRSMRDIDNRPAAIEVRLEFSGDIAPLRYELYAIDETSSNPSAVYRSARRAGVSHPQALARAQEQGRLAPVASGDGAPPSIRLSSHSVVMAIVDTR